VGDQDVAEKTDDAKLRAFMRALLDDVTALEEMLERGVIEEGIRRVGAEQEMFLIDDAQRPAAVATKVLERLNDDDFTTELAQFNLEYNAKPRVFGAGVLREMEDELKAALEKARAAAHAEHAEVLLTGILPTLRKDDLGLDNMTPMPRYYALNAAMTKHRGGDFRVNLKGIDELDIVHDNVMLESCNTSFQVHFQVSPHEFARFYNIAQAVTAPVMAAAVNSPTLLGHRLWSETRVGLFQQSIDDRSHVKTNRGHRPRVSFGDRWVEESVIEIFREDIARFRVLLAIDAGEDSLQVVKAGGVPSLRALRLHNGTVYRWNRACYGAHDGVAHLRVECRVLPAGPTVRDEVANAAFFYGLMSGFIEKYGDVREKMDFDDAKNNFFSSARYGLKAQFNWLGRRVPASELILDELAPLARDGLRAAGVEERDVETYIGVIEERARSERTGSQWALDSLAKMAPDATRESKLRGLVSGIRENQWSGKPVHTWPLAALDETADWRHSYRVIGQFMTQEVFTVRSEDLVDLAASMMDWERVRHIPVEDDEGKLVGLISHRDLLKLVARGLGAKNADPVTVGDIMRKDLVTVQPDTTTLEAIRQMRANKVGCLPVCEDGRLVGIVTERDFLDVAQKLMEKELKE
jgi:CBS domain-containing protein